jgi:endonuclease/exonuclease/phosphatase family metal-dependent hydrolase
MKLVTWNTQSFRGLDGVVSVERVIGEARALADFDVLCLQEVAVGYAQLTGGTAIDAVQRVCELLPGYEVRFGAAVDERGRGGERQRFGNLIAARWPVAETVHQRLPWPAAGGERSMPRMCTSVTLLAPGGALRVMTTHLEYYAPAQRIAQARSLLELHAQCCAHAAAPPAADESGEPFQSKVHTASALLCGDFNCTPSSPEYALLHSPAAAPASRLLDAWPLVHPQRPHAPTFCLHEHSYGEAPYACDFVFVTEDIAPRVRRIEVDLQTRSSDHQPVCVEWE